MAQGNSAEYRLQRLRRDHPAIADRYDSGEFRTVSAAERAAGYSNRPVLSPLDKAQRAVDKLSDADKRKLILKRQRAEK